MQSLIRDFFQNTRFLQLLTIMDHPDTESALSEAYNIPSQSSSQAISSAAPSVPADRTRHRPLRKGVIHTKNSTQSQLPFSRPTQRDPDDNRPLENIPTSMERQLENAVLADKEEEKPEDIFLDLPPHTPGPGSSVSQRSENSQTKRKRTRKKTSNVYTHCHIEQRLDAQYYVCNHCPKSYIKNGGLAI